MRLPLALGVAAALAASFARADDFGESKQLVPAVTSSSKPTGYFTDDAALELPHDGLDGKLTEKALAALPAPKRAFCSRSRLDIAKEATNGSTSLSFENPGGYVDAGVCWWHSRLQRSALYLANYLPGRPKPSREQALRLIDRLIEMDSVVEVPGYPDLWSFSKAYRKEMTEALSKWQLRAAVSVAPALNGLTGSAQERAAALQQRMQALNDRLLQKPDVVWQKLILGGTLASHSWLLARIRPLPAPTASNPLKTAGFQLMTVDPNKPTTVNFVEYRFGDTRLRYEEADADATGIKEGFIPETGYDDDLGAFEDAIRTYCKP